MSEALPEVLEEAPEEEVAPRRTVETDPLKRIMSTIADLRTAVSALQRAASFRNASISGGEGASIIDEVSGYTRIQLKPDGTVVVFDNDGVPVVRMGTMLETGDEAGADPFGIEVNVGGNWIQLGTQVVDWSNVGNKPSAFNPAAHNHPGSDITSAVTNATNAVNATVAAQADGVTSAAFTRVVDGIPGSWYAMYMHSTGVIGRSTSLEAHKFNLRGVPSLEADPYAILRVEPRLYDRRTENGDEYTPAASTNELGVIAEQVLAHVPELALYFDGELAGVRHEVGWVALLPVLRDLDRRMRAIELRLGTTEPDNGGI